LLVAVAVEEVHVQEPETQVVRVAAQLVKLDIRHMMEKLLTQERVAHNQLLVQQHPAIV
jgi:hypothetical protein